MLNKLLAKKNFSPWASIFQYKSYDLKHVNVNYSPLVNQLTSCFVNKVLLEYNWPHHLHTKYFTGTKLQGRVDNVMTGQQLFTIWFYTEVSDHCAKALLPQSPMYILTVVLMEKWGDYVKHKPVMLPSTIFILTIFFSHRFSQWRFIVWYSSFSSSG